MIAVNTGLGKTESWWVCGWEGATKLRRGGREGGSGAGNAGTASQNHRDLNPEKAGPSNFPAPG